MTTVHSNDIVDIKLEAAPTQYVLMDCKLIASALSRWDIIEVSTSDPRKSDSLQEKIARATLFTAITRHIAKDTILIIDGMNYNQGFQAREAGVRVATVYVLAAPDQCRKWNDEPGDGKGYKPQTLDALIQRFEEPLSMVRWDAPLFTIPWDDPTLPLERISDAVTTAIVKPPPNVGTQITPKAPTDTLRILEHTTNALVSALMAAQAAGPLGGPIVLTIDSLEHSSDTSATDDSSVLRVRLTLPHRALTLSELQWPKRRFVAARRKAVTLGSTEKGRVEWGEEGVGRTFAEFLEKGLGVAR
ncbi:chromatin associated protein KTI12-domain-containing protein [Suillus discolor]|uniref:Chromatin associated protein KTI12-domain-containing protein n=1 Tax=Suillus discolor TaxID=1912936 RepID=A0A9P7JX02_9AGAM|nr:chromatin associated protein KTI12-domain-containing protein [Suillus discolor]KAG2114280.1 chromatin associated protein KTI12-domain-containing protein [Suillus discolor]